MPLSDGTIEIIAGVATLTGAVWPDPAASIECAEIVIDNTSPTTTYVVASRDSDTQVTLTDLTAAEPALTTYTLQQWEYNAPDDYGGIIQGMTYDPEQWYYEVNVVSSERIRQQRQRDYTTGSFSDKPTLVASTPKKHTDQTTGQRFKFQFWPRPNSDYDLTYRYYVLAEKIDGTNKFPYGGQQHSETILASCLAVAELRINDEPGIHGADFQRRLAASIAIDKRAHTPENFGYNRDTSDGDEFPWVYRIDRVTVNGIFYTGV